MTSNELYDHANKRRAAGAAQAEMDTIYARCDVLEHIRRNPPTPSFEVGDGATACYYSDRKAGTVIEASAKRVVVQEDKQTLNNRDELTFTPGGFVGHMSGTQKYDYETDLEGRTAVYTLRKNDRWIQKGEGMRTGTRLTTGRHGFYDYNF